MIFDASGRAMRRSIGFLPEMVPLNDGWRPVVDLVGFAVETNEEDGDGDTEQE